MNGKYFHRTENGDKVEVPRLRFTTGIAKNNIQEFIKIFLLIVNQVSPAQHDFSLLAIVIVWILSLSAQITTDRRLSLLSHIHQPSRNL